MYALTAYLFRYVCETVVLSVPISSLRSPMPEIECAVPAGATQHKEYPALEQTQANIICHIDLTHPTAYTLTNREHIKVSSACSTSKP